MVKDLTQDGVTDDLSHVKLANELDVSEKLMLLLHLSLEGLFLVLDFFLALSRVLEELHETLSAELKELLSELAVPNVGFLGFVALDLELHTDDIGAEVGVETAVSVLGLSLSEDGLDDNLLNFFIDLEF